MPDTDAHGQELFTTDELAEYLRCDANAIHYLRAKGGGGPPAIRLSPRGRLLFRKTQVDQWLASRTEPAAQAY
jgi:Helix-turn-helix domain